MEHYAGRAGLVLLLLAVMVGGIAALGRWVSRNPDRVRAFGRRLVDRPFLIRVHSRYRAQLDFVGRRLKPGQALGLALTLQLAALGLAGWAFGAVVFDVVRGTGTVRFDTKVSRMLLTRRVAWLTTTMHGVSDFGGALLLAAVIVLLGLAARRYAGSWVPLMVLSAALVGAVVLGDVVKPLVARARPPYAASVGVNGYTFPSGHATQSIAVYGGLAYVAAGWLRTWSAKVAAWTIAVVVVLLIGFSRIYLGLHWVTDVLGGYALGAVWLAAVLVTTSAIQGAWRRHHLPATVTQPLRRNLSA
jgi:undecaprenyl-diphosphatase